MSGGSWIHVLPLQRSTRLETTRSTGGNRPARPAFDRTVWFRRTRPTSPLSRADGRFRRVAEGYPAEGDSNRYSLLTTTRDIQSHQRGAQVTLRVEPVLDDRGELVGVEARPADERAVDVGLGHQLGDVRRLHRPAVLDPDRRGGVGPRARRPRPDRARTPPARPRPWRCGRCRSPRSARRRRPGRRPAPASTPARPACDLARAPWPRCRPPRAPRASRPRT